MQLSVSKNNLEILRYESPELSQNEKYEVFIGRSEDCHIHLNDSKISRYHAVINFESGIWVIRKQTDFGELLINGIGVEQHKIRENDNITISDYTIKVSDIAVLKKEEEVTFDEQSNDIPEIDETESTNTIEDEVEQSIDVTKEEEDLSDFDEPREELSEVIEENKNDELNFNEEATDSYSEDSGDSFSDEGESPTFDDGFIDEEDNGFGGGRAESTQVLSSFVTFSLKIKGDLAPYDRYQIDDEEVIIGRDEKKCQIVLNDPEISGTHAKITKTLINCYLEDLNSSNGTFINGERINKKELENGDEFSIGETRFVLEVSSSLIEDEDGILMPVDEDQEIEVVHEIEEEVDFDDVGEEFDDEFSIDGAEEKSFLKNPQKRKKLIYGLVGVALLLMLLPEDEQKPKESDKGKSNTEQVKKVDEANKNKNENVAKVEKTKKRVLTKEERSTAEAAYQSGKAYVGQGKLGEALMEFKKVQAIDPNYNDQLTTLIEEVLESLKSVERRQKEIDAEKERQIRLKKIKELVDRAKQAVNKREVSVAEAIFTEISAIDPENVEVTRMKLELEAYEKEEMRKKVEAARIKKERDDMVEKLKPGKLHYIKKEWFKAILTLEKFLEEKSMAEDLIKEATDMLSESKRALFEQVDPLVGKARSLKEGQDLKAAYDVYLEVLQIDPGNEEALTEIDNIKTMLENRSRKVYREALISESLSLFKEAKEKLEQVQQISPTDSEYYRKATDKLKDYME